MMYPLSRVLLTPPLRETVPDPTSVALSPPEERKVVETASTNRAKIEGRPPFVFFWESRRASGGRTERDVEVDVCGACGKPWCPRIS